MLVLFALEAQSSLVRTSRTLIQFWTSWLVDTNANLAITARRERLLRLVARKAHLTLVLLQDFAQLAQLVQYAAKRTCRAPLLALLVTTARSAPLWRWCAQAGTVGAEKGLKSAADCALCHVGRYCEGTVTQKLLPCAEGYFCAAGATIATPADWYQLADFNNRSLQVPRPNASIWIDNAERNATNGPCPVGHFCPSATTTPQPCPPGTVLNSTGAASVR